MQHKITISAVLACSAAALKLETNDEAAINNLFSFGGHGHGGHGHGGHSHGGHGHGGHGYGYGHGDDICDQNPNLYECVERKVISTLDALTAEVADHKD